MRCGYSDLECLKRRPAPGGQVMIVKGIGTNPGQGPGLVVLCPHSGPLQVRMLERYWTKVARLRPVRRDLRLTGSGWGSLMVEYRDHDRS